MVITRIQPYTPQSEVLQPHSHATRSPVQFSGMIPEPISRFAAEKATKVALQPLKAISIAIASGIGLFALMRLATPLVKSVLKIQGPIKNLITSVYKPIQEATQNIPTGQFAERREQITTAIQTKLQPVLKTLEDTGVLKHAGELLKKENLASLVIGTAISFIPGGKILSEIATPIIMIALKPYLSDKANDETEAAAENADSEIPNDSEATSEPPSLDETA